MRKPKVSVNEKKLLQALLSFYREFGPGATPNMSGLEEEAGIMKHELEDAVLSLQERGFIEFWELGPALRLTREGLIFITSSEGTGEAED